MILTYRNDDKTNAEIQENFGAGQYTSIDFWRGGRENSMFRDSTQIISFYSLKFSDFP